MTGILSVFATQVDLIGFSVELMVEHGVGCHMSCRYKSNFVRNGSPTLVVQRLQSRLASMMTSTPSPSAKVSLTETRTEIEKCPDINIQEMLSGCTSVSAAIDKLKGIQNKDTSYTTLIQKPSDILKMSETQKLVQIEIARKVMHDLLQLFIATGQFKKGGQLIISNTSTAPVSKQYIFQHFEKQRNLLGKKALPRTERKKITATCKVLEAGVGDVTYDIQGKCILCKHPKLEKYSVKNEACFWSKGNFSQRQILALHRFLRVKNLNVVLNPLYKVRAHQQGFRTVENQIGLIDLFGDKKKDSDDSQKVKVPYIALKDPVKGMGLYFVQSDREGVYMRQKWQRADQRVLLWGIDKGGKNPPTTKFGYIDTHKSTYNTGLQFKILHSFERAPDTYQNMALAYKDLAPVVSDLHESFVFRMRNKLQRKFCAAVVHGTTHVLIPTMFMVRTTDISETDLTSWAESSSGCHYNWKLESLSAHPKQKYRLRGSNIASFVKVLPDVEDPTQLAAYSVVTVNLGGAQLDYAMWGLVASYLKVQLCPAKLANRNCRCPTNPATVKEIGMMFVPWSESLFGNLLFETLSETRLEGDNLHLFGIQEGRVVPTMHGAEICSQQLKNMLAADFLASFTLRGFFSDFCRMTHPCEFCDITTAQLNVPYKNLDPKPNLRTEASMLNNLHTFQATNCKIASKGIIHKPIFDWVQSWIVPHFLHTILGAWNKIYQHPKKLLLQKIENQLISRLPAAKELNRPCEEMDASIKVMIRENQAVDRQLKKLEPQLKPLEESLKKYQAPSLPSNRMAELLQAEIRPLEQKITGLKATKATNNATIDEHRKRIKANKAKIKQLQGPVTKAYRSFLLTVGIDPTIYWENHLLGPILQC